MPDQKIEMACECGKLRGHCVGVSPQNSRHLVCMCKDCQTFARFLGRDDVLDQNGGTEIFQITPSQVRIEKGQEHLCVARLSPKGTFRWYASCCNTPIANTTPSAGFPFSGIFCAFMANKDQANRANLLGPIQERFFARDSLGTPPEGTHEKVPTGYLIKTLFWLLRNKIAGRAKPSPFFADDKTPVAVPKVLSQEERTRFSEQKSPA